MLEVKVQELISSYEQRLNNIHHTMIEYNNYRGKMSDVRDELSILSQERKDIEGFIKVLSVLLRAEMLEREGNPNFININSF